MNCDPEINTGTENFASKGVPVFIKPGGYFFVDVVDDGSLGHYLVSFPEPGGLPGEMRAQTGFFLMFGRSSRPHERSCGHDAPSAFPHCLFIHIMHFFEF